MGWYLRAIHGIPIPMVILTLVYVVLLSANVAVPPIVFHGNVRDSDVGLWFLSGVLLAQLSSFGLISHWPIGHASHRVLIAIGGLLGLVVSAWVSVRLCGPISRADSVGYLTIFFGSALFFAACDTLWLHGCTIDNSLKPSESCRNDPARHRFSFGTGALFWLIGMCAIAATFVKSVLQIDQIAYRHVRSYSDRGWMILLVLGLFFWLLHATFLMSILGHRRRKWTVVWIVIAIVGTEAIRHLLQWNRSGTLDYLNWEFTMIVFGFVIAHAVTAALIRWFGWTLDWRPQSLLNPSSDSLKPF